LLTTVARLAGPGGARAVVAESVLVKHQLAEVLGHAKDSLWSVDLFRCESAVLHTYWVLVVMDHWTPRIVGLGVHRGVVDGVALCRSSTMPPAGSSFRLV